MKEKNITGDDILSARVYLKITQDELSAALNHVGATSVSRWENGHANPHSGTLYVIDHFFSRKIGKSWQEIVLMR